MTHQETFQFKVKESFVSLNSQNSACQILEDTDDRSVRSSEGSSPSVHRDDQGGACGESVKCGVPTVSAEGAWRDGVQE